MKFINLFYLKWLKRGHVSTIRNQDSKFATSDNANHFALSLVLVVLLYLNVADLKCMFISVYDRLADLTDVSVCPKSPKNFIFLTAIL